MKDHRDLGGGERTWGGGAEVSIVWKRPHGVPEAPELTIQDRRGRRLTYAGRG